MTNRQLELVKLLENNGSVFALSSQLAAFCGTIYRRT